MRRRFGAIDLNGDIAASCWRDLHPPVLVLGWRDTDPVRQ